MKNKANKKKDDKKKSSPVVAAPVQANPKSQKSTDLDYMEIINLAGKMLPKEDMEDFGMMIKSSQSARDRAIELRIYLEGLPSSKALLDINKSKFVLDSVHGIKEDVRDAMKYLKAIVPEGSMLEGKVKKLDAFVQGVHGRLEAVYGLFNETIHTNLTKLITDTKYAEQKLTEVVNWAKQLVYGELSDGQIRTVNKKDGGVYDPLKGSDSVKTDANLETFIRSYAIFIVNVCKLYTAAQAFQAAAVSMNPLLIKPATETLRTCIKDTMASIKEIAPKHWMSDKLVHHIEQVVGGVVPMLEGLSNLCDYAAKPGKLFLSDQQLSTLESFYSFTKDLVSSEGSFLQRLVGESTGLSKSPMVNNALNMFNKAAEWVLGKGNDKPSLKSSE